MRKSRPDARLIVLTNQAFDLPGLTELMTDLERYGVEMVEQPMKVGDDTELEGFKSPIPTCS